MSDFTPEAVVAALNALYSDQGEHNEDANSFIVEWVNSEDAYLTAFQILQDEENSVEIRSIAAMTLANQIMSKWGQIDQMVRCEIRSELVDAPLSYRPLQKNINRCTVPCSSGI